MLKSLQYFLLDWDDSEVVEYMLSIFGAKGDFSMVDIDSVSSGLAL